MQSITKMHLFVNNIEVMRQKSLVIF